MSINETMDTMQAWTHALRLGMGYPQVAPIGNPTAFASSGRKDLAGALEVAAIVEQSGQDMVRVGFDLPIVDGPVDISLFTRAIAHVDWHDDVQPWLASDDSRIELLTGTQRWSVGPRSVLTASPLPPRSRIKRGIERAHRRWRELAGQVHGIHLSGSRFIPAGATLAEAVPMESLRSAA